MERIHRIALIIAASATTMVGGGALASTTVTWADWTSAGANTVSGTLGGVSVTFTGSYSFAQINDSGTDYWADRNGDPIYTGGVVNRPTGVDLIALDAGGSKTLTFSQPVSDVYMALTSWNGNTPTFDAPFTIVSQGCGYWGCGNFTSVTDYSFYGNGEVHGVIEFKGTFTSLTFSDSSEYWHGFTIGTAIPEPSTWAMMLVGFASLGLASWQASRKAAASAA